MIETYVKNNIKKNSYDIVVQFDDLQVFPNQI